MSMITMIRSIKQIHPKDIVMFKMGSFYHTYSKDAYIMSYLFDYKTKKIEQNYSTCVNGKIICRKMAKKNVVFPTYFLYHEFMI